MPKSMSLLLPVLLTFAALGGCAGAQKQQAAPVAKNSEDKPPHAQMIGFVLTRCPYAAPMIRSLVELKREMGASLDLTIMYLGMLDDQGRPDPTIVGQPEVDAARTQICIQLESEAPVWLDFLACIYSENRWRNLPAGWRECASQANVDIEKVDNCIEGGTGDEALAQSYAIALASEITASPTLIVDRKLYVGAPTKAALATHFCHVAGSAETRPAPCAKVPPPPVVAATLLYDSRCSEPAVCDVSRATAVLHNLLPGLVMQEHDFVSSEGRRMFELIQASDAKVTTLPLIVLDETITRDPSAMSRLGDYLIPFGSGYLLAMGTSWDPLAEICTNNRDDTDNGLIDCADPSCREKRDCRPDKKARLDLFFMSGCPFSAELLPAADRVLDHFGRKRTRINLQLQFIGSTQNDELISMHGQEEVAEDLRMICAQKLYAKKYRFMEYVLCRAKSYDSPEWESCVPKWMNKKRLRRCAEGVEGKTLLKESFALAERLDIQASPSWLLNNRLPMEGRTEKAIKENFCALNDSPACSKQLAPSETPAMPPPATGRCQ